MTDEPTVVGRFAPSPSGPLHLGSLLTALASFLDVRCRGGRWLLRIDDIDAPRSVPGSIEQIRRALEHHGLHWDSVVSYQSENQVYYQRALEQLGHQRLLYRCSCTRKMVAGRPYPGTCRLKNRPLTQPGAVRLRVPQELDWIDFSDELLGLQRQQITADSGDFIVQRADGLISYQLAVVVDDATTGVNRVVRGADLLPSTPRQILLHKLLNLPPPSYLHLPVVINKSGTKLSKQAHAQPLDSAHPSQNLHLLLQLLQQAPPDSLVKANPVELLAWAIEHWQPHALPATPELAGYIAH